jgi:DNA-binding transcriptional ArsR family regulator
MIELVKKEGLSSEAIDLIASRFKILGEPLRIRILQALQAGERSVGQLTTLLGSTQPNVSKHLRILQDAGLVGRRQEGNTVYCFIADPSVMDLCDAVCESLEARLRSQADKIRRVRR